VKIDFHRCLDQPNRSLSKATAKWSLRNTLRRFTYYTIMRSANGSLEFLRRISRRRRSAQCGVESISEYVEQSASLLRPEPLDEVRRELPILNLQFAALSVRQFPHLQQQLKLLTDFLEDTAAGVFPDGSEASRKETAFALRYMAKEADIIPDSVPEIGYADDSLIVRTVLSRHQDVFRDYCRFRKIRWSKISFAP
jgi:uncharacterized membrane protein YkvA (DUF1232 family)